MAWWMLRVVSMLSDYKQQKYFFIIKTYYGLIQHVPSCGGQVHLDLTNNEIGRYGFDWNYTFLSEDVSRVEECFKGGQR